VNERGPNWLLIGGLAIAAWWLMGRQTPPAAAPVSASILPPNQWGAAAPRPAPGPGGVFGSVGTY